MKSLTSEFFVDIIFIQAWIFSLVHHKVKHLIYDNRQFRAIGALYVAGVDTTLSEDTNMTRNRNKHQREHNETFTAYKSLHYYRHQMAVTVSKSVSENWLHLDRELGISVWGLIHKSLVEKSLMSSILFFFLIHKTMLTNRHIKE